MEWGSELGDWSHGTPDQLEWAELHFRSRSAECIGAVKRPIRIVVVSGNTPPVIDGVSHYTAALLKRMVDLRPDWEWLWVGRRQRWFHAPLLSASRLRVLRPHHTWSELGAQLATVPIRLLRPDILHIQDQIHSFHETRAAVILAGAAAGRVITTLHEFHTELPSVRHTIELVGRSEILIANDARTALRCANWTMRPVDYSWWSGSNIPPPEPSWRIEKAPGLVTTFGMLSPIKALDLVYEGLARIRENRPDLRWQVVGPFDPAANPLHAQLKSKFSPLWVHFLGGFKNHEGRDLRTVLGSSEVMLLPFTDGASPRRTTLQTAWAFGLPVVTTPPQVNEPDVVDGLNCVLVREQTPEAWATAIDRVLSDAALRGQLEEGSLATARHFGWDRLARLHIELYESFVGRTGHQLATRMRHD